MSLFLKKLFFFIFFFFLFFKGFRCLWVRSDEDLNLWQEKIPVEKVFEALKCTREGLTSSEGDKRLQIFGPNKLEEKKESKVLKFLGFMWNPLSWVMECAAVMAIALANGGVRYDIIPFILCSFSREREREMLINLGFFLFKKIRASHRIGRILLESWCCSSSTPPLASSKKIMQEMQLLLSWLDLLPNARLIIYFTWLISS